MIPDDEMKKKAEARVKEDQEGSCFKAADPILKNIMDGTLVTVTFKTHAGKDAYSLVHFDRRNEMTIYKWRSQVLAAVSSSRERAWFFRFIQLADVSGVIAFFLILAFSILLFVLAFVPTANATVL